jgi:peptide/nickel transport system ATP-binding protein
MSEEALLKVSDLRGYYKGSFGVIHAVDGVSLIVKPGEILGIAGESGCGKSTFLKLLTGIVEPPLFYEGGEVIIQSYRIFNLNYEELRRKVLGKLVAYVPQSSYSALMPVLKICKFVADLLKEHAGRNYSLEEIYEMLADHLDMLNLDKRVLGLYPHELSGGMRQRTVIAISTILRPALLLLDEPTSALDVISQRRLMQMLVNLRQKEVVKSIIISSHDLAVLRQMCDLIGIMYAGRLVEMGENEDVINNPLHPYAEMLLDSLILFEPSIKFKTLTGIPGRPPDLSNPPKGCRFHPRCPKRMDICVSEAPPIIKEQNRLVECWLYARR